MRKLLSFTFFLLLQTFAFSQNLTIQGTAPNLYLEHTVAAKENFYSIGRLYNQAPKTIAAYNNIVMEKGLTIGQHIRVPLNEQNYDNTGTKNAGENLLPITHLTGAGETLFRISNNNGLKIEQLKQLNKLTSDAIGKGSTLIVGYLKIKTDPMSASVKSNAGTVVPTPVKEVILPPKEIVSPPPAKPEVPVVITKTPTQPAKEDSAIVFVSQSSSSTAKEIEDKAVSIRGSGVKSSSIKSEPVLNKASSEQVKQVPVKQIPPKSAPAETTTIDTKKYEDNTGSSAPDEGAFSTQFLSNSGGRISNQSGEAASFKSTSGWQDKKYYALINDVAPGTIIKVISSNKIVFAKVLGSLPEMKENTDLLLRLSNSAASHLGIVDSKFQVQISYYQ